MNIVMDTKTIDLVVETRRNAPELFDIGNAIPLGVVPKKMHAWTIRRENHGEPQHAFTNEIVDVPSLGPNDVLVLVMAAGVNYNGVWAALGQPFSVLDLHDDPYHITGSDAAGRASASEQAMKLKRVAVPKAAPSPWRGGEMSGRHRIPRCVNR